MRRKSRFVYELGFMRVFLRLIRFSALTLLVSCSEDAVEQALLPEESQELILGNWVFNESSIEIISNPDDQPFGISPPDLKGLEWTFFDNDSLLVEDSDTLFTLWYKYDSISMSLQVDDGLYEVSTLNEDSLNVRFLAELNTLSIEYYLLLSWLRGSE